MTTLGKVAIITGGVAAVLALDWRSVLPLK